MPKRTVSDKKMTPFVPAKKNLPATQEMLRRVRNELKAEMKAGFKNVESKFDQMESRFNQIDSKFSQNDSRFSQIESRFSQIDARFNQTDAKMELVLSEVARIGVLVEEQNSNNRIVLEGLSGLWQRQEQFESRLTNEVDRSVAAAFIRLKT